MSTVLDLLQAPEFADSRLTESINIPPYRTGRPAQLGIFTDTPIATTYVRLAITDGEITIIPARERGGENNLNMSNDLRGVTIDIPHFPLDDAIRPSDLQNIMAFGEDYVFETLQSVMNDKLQNLRSKHDATHHHLDWGALNGLVIDAEGKLIVNLYNKFDLTANVVNFALDTSGTDVAAKNREAKSILRKNLRGAATRGAVVLAGGTFFDKYVSHQYVRENLKNYAGATANPSRDDVEDTFTFAGMKLERIDEEFSYRRPDGTFVARPAVAADEAILLPLGTQLFKRYIAPPDTIADANTRPRPGDKVFVSTERLKHNKGLDIHTESNVLPICTRPEVLVKLKAN
ncbi:major capsid protein [Rhizobium sp. CFBP 8762]|uniref:major capsid protein n=1 Tax=Rhizobium sp. CFBP 8762 TaxID=2775279 RepID=UPI001784DB3B|nr:major capsid protein [Rhizobium sp. CFBP 8762]MBD8555548.1 major capsid protein [Rhizobium sp. CFBP 8762]